MCKYVYRYVSACVCSTVSLHICACIITVRMHVSIMMCVHMYVCISIFIYMYVCIRASESEALRYIYILVCVDGCMRVLVCV